MQRIQIGDVGMLIVPDGVDVQLIMQPGGGAHISLSPAAAGYVDKAGRAEARRRAAGEALDAWLQSEVDLSAPGEVEETRALFASYLDHCGRSAVPDGARMSLTAFGKALTDRGLVKRKNNDGHIERRGCQLRRTSRSSARVAGNWGFDFGELPQRARAAMGRGR